MLKKTITFPDLDGNDVTEDFYFNLNKAELAELELSHKSGLADHLRKIVDANDGGAIMDKFKEIITMSVGRRSEDGRRFIKNEEITNEFLQTNAYSELFIELVTDADAAAAFIRGIVPTDLKEAVDKGEKVTDLETADEVPAWIAEDREPTKAELQSMTKQQMAAVIARKVTRD